MRLRLLQTESFRLAAIYAGLFLVSTLFLMALVFLAVSHAFEADLLRASTDDLAAIGKAYTEAEPRGKALHEAKEMIDDRLLATDSADVFLLQSGRKKVAGNLPFMSLKSGELRFPYPIALGGNAMAGHTILGRGMTLGHGDYAFVGRDLQAARDAEKDVFAAFAVVLAAGLLVAAAGGTLLSRSFVKRVDAITATCRSIMTGNLGERIPVSGSRNELDQLGATINEMLDRINALMESLRQVSNDIAHDLRTPLTHLRQKLERARLAAPSLDQYGEAVDGAIGDCDELIAMFGALLRIAQIEAGVRRSAMRLVDLSEILRNVLSLYTPLLDDSGHPFRVELDENLWINGDRQLLLRMFANLLDNAIRHTSSGTPIAISTLRSAEKTVVTIADKGAGIPPSDREKVFQRFFRRESSRTTPGSGLGLSLVGAIAELHECRIVLSDNAPGLRVSIEFSAVKLQEVPRAAE